MNDIKYVPRTPASTAIECRLLESIVDPDAIKAERELAQRWTLRWRLKLAVTIAWSLVKSPHKCQQYRETQRVF